MKHMINTTTCDWNTQQLDLPQMGRIYLGTSERWDIENSDSTSVDCSWKKVLNSSAIWFVSNSKVITIWQRLSVKVSLFISNNLWILKIIVHTISVTQSACILAFYRFKLQFEHQNTLLELTASATSPLVPRPFTAAVSWSESSSSLSLKCFDRQGCNGVESVRITVFWSLWRPSERARLYVNKNSGSNSGSECWTQKW